MDISNQMLEAVANAKKQAKSAESQFDFAAEMVNIKSSSSIDLFGGSGTTIIAAEQNGRTAFVMEYDPRFVDVIIARWEALTGNKAVLLDD